MSFIHAVPSGCLLVGGHVRGVRGEMYCVIGFCLFAFVFSLPSISFYLSQQCICEACSSSFAFLSRRLHLLSLLSSCGWYSVCPRPRLERLSMGQANNPPTPSRSFSLVWFVWFGFGFVGLPKRLGYLQAIILPSDIVVLCVCDTPRWALGGLA